MNKITRSQSTILFPYAHNDSQELVSALSAPKHEPYFCPGCHKSMLLRRGKKNQPHFSHAADSNNCSPESVLHQLAKELIKTGIEQALDEKRSYDFLWYCVICGGRNQGDLAKTSREIKMEVQLDNIRPDLLISNLEGKPLVAIEIVVTHAPEESTLAVYQHLNLPVLIIHIDWDDLPAMGQNLLHTSPTVFNAKCPAPEHPLSCPECKQQMDEVEIEIWHGYRCYNCKKPMPVLFFSQSIENEEDALPHIDKVAGKLNVPFRIYRTKDNIVNYAHRCKHCNFWARNLYVYTGRYQDWSPNPDEPVLTSKYFWCGQCNHWEMAN